MAARSQDQGRSYVSGQFMMELDGKNAGWIKSVDGGHCKAEVIEEKLGPSYFAKKHIGGIKYEDISIQLGMSCTENLYKWIEESWKGNYFRKDGAVIAANHKQEGTRRMDFVRSLIKGVGMPACDGGSKEPCYMTLKLTPETVKMTDAGGGKLAGAQFGDKSPQKVWQPANFRLEIEGLDCTRVNKLDAFEVSMENVRDDIGSARDMSVEAGPLKFPNLKVTLSESTAEDWYKYHEDFVIKGNCDESKEKSGALIYLTPNLQTELARITFFNLGIFSFTTDKGEAHANTIKRCTAELYCERMEFGYLASKIM